MRKMLFVLAASLLSVGMASAQTSPRTQDTAVSEPRPDAPSQARSLGQPLPAGTHTVMYKDKTVYDFDADEVVVTMVSPDSVMVDGRLGPKFGSMLKPRASFQPELLKSADSL
ncbi:MAG: hypothetical protein U1A78_18260 [Polyangia bacterium]